MVCPADLLPDIRDSRACSAEVPFGWLGPLEPEHITMRSATLLEEYAAGDSELLSQPPGSATAGFLCSHVEPSFSISFQMWLRVRMSTMTKSNPKKMQRSPAGHKGKVCSITLLPTPQVPR